MELAKPRVDIGMTTNALGPVLAFWQGEAGVPFDHLLPVRWGQDQHRHDANGSVLKINAYAEPVPAGQPTGYRELYLAREGLEAPGPWPTRTATASPSSRPAGGGSPRPG